MGSSDFHDAAEVSSLSDEVVLSALARERASRRALKRLLLGACILFLAAIVVLALVGLRSSGDLAASIAGNPAMSPAIAEVVAKDLESESGSIRARVDKVVENSTLRTLAEPASRSVIGSVLGEVLNDPRSEPSVELDGRIASAVEPVRAQIAHAVATVASIEPGVTGSGSRPEEILALVARDEELFLQVNETSQKLDLALERLDRQLAAMEGPPPEHPGREFTGFLIGTGSLVSVPQCGVELQFGSWNDKGVRVSVGRGFTDATSRIDIGRVGVNDMVELPESDASSSCSLRVTSHIKRLFVPDLIGFEISLVDKPLR